MWFSNNNMLYKVTLIYSTRNRTCSRSANVLLFERLSQSRGARYLNLYEPLCGVVEYVIVNPTWRPDFNLVESKLNPELQDFIY